MNGSPDFELNEQDRPQRATAHPRAVGSPLPMGGSGRTPLPPLPGEVRRSVPPPGRALVNPEPEPSQTDQGANTVQQRAVNILRQAMPFVQRLLPLLDGNIGSAVSNVLTQRPHPPAPPQPPVNLAPLQGGLAEIQAQQLELRDQIAEQNTSLKRVEDQLDMVREATDRNTLEQQELMEDLKAVGQKVNLLALLAFGLLAVSIVINLILFLHIQRVLP